MIAPSELLTAARRPVTSFVGAGPDTDEFTEPYETEGGVTARTERVARAFRGLMDALELDPADPHLQGTEWRVARAYEEMFRGLSATTEPELRTFANEEGYAAPVSMTGIPFYSLCAHHFLPFFGEAQVIYVPSNRLVGLSKLARAVDYMARRPQVQERLTEQIADLLDQRLEPAGVMVVLEARHLCMEMRGARSRGTTRTVAARGVLTDGALQRQLSLTWALSSHPAPVREADR